MDERTITTSWMWMSEQGVNGLRIDRDNHIMKWYDVIGCECDMDELATEQTFPQYQQEGTPTHLAQPPADVLAEIVESIKKIENAL